MLEKAFSNAYKVFTRNLASLQDTSDFKSLEWNHLVWLLGKTCEEYRDERVIFEATMKWIGHDNRRRREYVSECLQKVVRLSKLSPRYLVQNVYSHAMLSNESIYSTLIMNALVPKFNHQCSTREFYNEIKIAGIHNATPCCGIYKVRNFCKYQLETCYAIGPVNKDGTTQSIWRRSTSDMYEIRIHKIFAKTTILQCTSNGSIDGPPLGVTTWINNDQTIHLTLSLV